MRIYISYSPQDRSIVELIAGRLTAIGHEVSTDHLNLRAGDNISKKVQEEIASVDALLLVVSANSLSSKLTLQEFSSLALAELSNRGARLIPILIDSSSVPGYLSDYNYIDFNKGLGNGLSTLLVNLELVERNEPQARTQRIEQRDDTRKNQIFALGKALKQGRLTLVCGAGVSVGAGVPTWNQLLLRLLTPMIDRISTAHSLEFSTDTAAIFNNLHGSSPLILGKYLKNNLGDDFCQNVRDSLYFENTNQCELIDAIVDLSRPQRNGRPVDSIITFNFDALIEENLTAAHIPNRAIYSEAISHDPNELPIYHVHGYLPRRGDIPPETDIVFSEDAYHNQFMEPFSWSNLVQLNKLAQNTCLFVGLSLTDPNLRRLLDVAWRKNPEKSPSHYIIKKLPRPISGNNVFNDLAQLLEEQDANALGINVIWVNGFDEIPEIIRSVH